MPKYKSGENELKEYGFLPKGKLNISQNQKWPTAQSNAGMQYINDITHDVSGMRYKFAVWAADELKTCEHSVRHLSETLALSKQYLAAKGKKKLEAVKEKTSKELTKPVRRKTYKQSNRSKMLRELKEAYGKDNRSRLN